MGSPWFLRKQVRIADRGGSQFNENTQGAWRPTLKEKGILKRLDRVSKKLCTKRTEKGDGGKSRATESWTKSGPGQIMGGRSKEREGSSRNL